MDSRRGLLCLTLAVAALALPQAAQATVFCVPAPAPGCTQKASINAAVTAASNGDTIDIAAGTYAEAISTNKSLNFVGAGSGTLSSTTGATVIAAPPGATAFNLTRGGSLRSLRAVGGSSISGGTAITLSPDVDGSFSYSLTDVIGLGGTATDSFGFAGSGLQALSAGAARVVNLSVSGGAFQAGGATIFQGYGTYLSGVALTASVTNTSVRGATSGTGTALLVAGGPTVNATGVSVQGTSGGQISDSNVNLRRSVVEGANQGLAVYESSTAAPTNVAVTDSLILATTTSAVDGVALSAITTSGSGTLTIPVRGSTIIARGVDPGFAVASRPQSGAPMATIDLRNSIARLQGTAEGSDADVVADRGTVTAANSDFATRLELNGGAATAPGSGTNLTADPLFNAGAFTLRSSSPLIDRGDPTLVTAGELDLAGHPRFAGAAPDIGAFEYQPPAPPPPPPPPANEKPSLSKVSMTNKVFAPVGAQAAAPRRARKVKRGTTFRYVLSEAATVSVVVERRATGRRVGKRCVKPSRRTAKRHKCKRWVRAGTLRAAEQAGRQSTFFTGRLRKRALKPGRYRARIVAKDGAGARSRERRLAFRIVRAR
jgi:hypothetical protein